MNHRDTEQSAADELLLLERTMRRQLRWIDIPERARLVAETVLDHSLAVGRERAVFPTKRLLATVSGVHEKHIREAECQLSNMRIIEIDEVMGTYTPLADSRFWRATPKSACANAATMDAKLRQAYDDPAQMDLLPRDRTLMDAIAEVSRQRAIEQSEIRQQAIVSLQGVVIQPTRTDGHEKSSPNRGTSVQDQEKFPDLGNSHMFHEHASLKEHVTGERGESERGEFPKNGNSEFMERLAEVMDDPLMGGRRWIWQQRCKEYSKGVRFALDEYKLCRVRIRNVGGWLNDRYWWLLHERAKEGCPKALAILQEQAPKTPLSIGRGSR